jgi:hypothetical protein
VGALEHQGAALVGGAGEQGAGVGDEAANAIGHREIGIDETGGLERLSVDGLADGVFFAEDRLELAAETIGVEQIGDAEAAAGHLVFVGGADAAAGGADFGLGARDFRRPVELAMIGENQMGAAAEEEPAVDIDASLGERVDLGQQRLRVDHDAVSNDGFLARAEDSRRDELKNEFFAVPDDGMAGVMAALATGDVVERGGQIVDHLPLAFVAPLGAHHDNRSHRSSWAGVWSTRIPGCAPGRKGGDGIAWDVRRLSYLPPPSRRKHAGADRRKWNSGQGKRFPSRGRQDAAAYPGRGKRVRDARRRRPSPKEKNPETAPGGKSGGAEFSRLRGRARAGSVPWERRRRADRPLRRP